MFKVQMPHLMRLKKTPINSSPNQATPIDQTPKLKELTQVSFNDQSTTDISRLVVEADIKEEDYLNEISQALDLTHNEDTTLSKAQNKFRIDEQLYAEQVYKQNEMILNKQLYTQRQKNAKNMKINALKHEISKVEKRTDLITNDLNQHTQGFGRILENKKHHDQETAKGNLRIQFELIQKQIDQALQDDQSEYNPSIVNSSELYNKFNREVNEGFEQNEQLFEELEKLQNLHSHDNDQKQTIRSSSNRGKKVTEKSMLAEDSISVAKKSIVVARNNKKKIFR